MSDRKQTPRAGGGWPGGTLWLMKWAVIVALVVLLLLFIVPRGASAWNGQSAPDKQHASPNQAMQHGHGRRCCLSGMADVSVGEGRHDL